MGWKQLTCLVALTLANVVAADTNAHSHVVKPAGGTNVKVIAKGAFSGIQEPKQIVVTNATQWAELWQKHSVKREPKPQAPEIDFSKQTVLFVSLGEKRTGGYGVEIADVKKDNGKTEVTVKTKSPKPGGFQIQAITAPFVIVAIPKVEGEVQFKTGS
jgi:hypothetical protein